MPRIRARATHRATALILLMLLLATPRSARAHVRLESSAPGDGAVLTAAPTKLQLRFSAHIEARYTQLVLAGPDERLVPIGAITFAAGSDREFSADLPPLVVRGVYTVRWRTAGADGHPLEGSFRFTLEPAADPRTGHGVPVDSAPAAHEHHIGDPAEHMSSASSSPAHALGRGLHFGALTLLLGALAFRLLLLPRVPVDDVVAAGLRRRVWRTASFAALALVAAALFRLWLQSAAMHGSDRAWSVPLLTMMLTTTSWGRVWVVQAVLLGGFAAALAVARPHRDSLALVLALPAALGLAAVPALSGHAAGAERGAVLAVINDAVHVSAAGAWLGTLALILFAALPALGRSHASEATAAALIERFSPLALVAAALLVLTGVVNSLLHFTAPAQLVASAYGRTLLIKLGIFSGVLAAGAFNWRRLKPRLGAPGTTAWLRRSIALELLFAAGVLAATAYLTGLARPG